MDSRAKKPVEIKLRFRDGLLWTVSLTVERKLRFDDGLVWTVSQTAEIKLRLQNYSGLKNVFEKLRFEISLG